MIEFDIKIGSDDLYDFKLKHTYSSSSGIVGTTFGAVLIVLSFYKQSPLPLVLGLIVLFYQPVVLWINSKKQAILNNVYKKPLHVVIDDEGVTVSQDETETKCAWDDFRKAVSTTRSIILYNTGINAVIFPKKQLGDKKAEVIAAISRNMPPARVNIKE
ncbi:MAG: YcxB family protein [Lachnospiraceae bacterium]|nr:YcxB family protein [Lachnospiraceae bacterium]